MIAGILSDKYISRFILIKRITSMRVYLAMTKFNNLKVKRVKSNLKYTESKLVKKDHGKRKKF